MNTSPPYGIHWFRRDLNLDDNEALLENILHHKGRVIGVFFFDQEFLNRPDFSARRFHFFLNTLKNLQKKMESIGGQLLIFDIKAQDGFAQIFKKQKPTLITWNRDYEPYARKRDNSIIKLLEQENIVFKTFRHHLIIEPWEIKNGLNEPYKVFTAFKKNWLNSFFDKNLKERCYPKTISSFSSVELSLEGLSLANLDSWLQQNKNKLDLDESYCLFKEDILKSFNEKIFSYDKSRDFPELPGTSQFAKYIKNGSLTTSQIIAHFHLNQGPLENAQNIFLSELIWREFYYHSLYHNPRTEHEACILKYKNIKWDNNLELWEKWKQGETGFPLVDAGMRELKQTGFMHNRVRMVVASFLVKNLHIDWRWGERYFMRMLLDGDLAPNNGGWQWCASTGYDSQPYFRIFNPTNQAKRFDENAHYIKKYIPELKQLSAKEIFSGKELTGYAKPIIDYKTRTQKTLELYKEATE